MSDEELVIHARNWEAASFMRHPYMYNRAAEAMARPHPGADPGAVGGQRPVVTPITAGAYSRLIPRGAACEIIDEAGHHPGSSSPTLRRARRRLLRE